MTTITVHDVERYASIDLYGVLHLMPGASAELIDKAYRLRMREVHPDLAGAARTEQAALVNTAREILRQPTARARYDALRAARRARPGMSQGSPPSRQQGARPRRGAAPSRAGGATGSGTTGTG